jgi:hypothetical protein
MLITIQGTLAADVADTGNFTVSYPARPAGEIGVTDAGDFYGAMEHEIIVGSNKYGFPDDLAMTFGTANITVTNRSGATWKAGTSFTLGLQMQGKPLFRSDRATGKQVARAAKSQELLILLGAPDVLDADGICAAQGAGGAANLNINGALASGGSATLDVPRGVQAVSAAAGDNTQTLTITGVDEYGKAMKETLALNGVTPVVGKKAFKKVTQVAISAASAGNITVGTTDILGLPVFVPSVAHVLKEMQDGAVAAAGAFVGGIATANGSTATTGDVRGTYDPNAAADGARVFQLIVSLPDPDYLGIAQFS